MARYCDVGGGERGEGGQSLRSQGGGREGERGGGGGAWGMSEASVRERAKRVRVKQVGELGE